jgi:hypothetical protein
VLLKRFAASSGPHQGLICPFRLEYPLARHRPLGSDGCAKVDVDRPGKFGGTFLPT